MNRAYLVVVAALAVTGVAQAAEAEQADAGVGEAPPESSTPPSVFFRNDGGFEVPIDFPGRLAAGSSLGAGIDIKAVGEVIHPSNPAALVVGLRRAGGVLEGGTTSAAVQFNPYMLLKGESQLYDEAVAARTDLMTRLLQDAAVTVALAPGTPYEGGATDTAHATAGAGLSVELLGYRSIYGPTYSQCLNAKTSRDAIGKMMAVKPFQPRAYVRRAGETDEAYAQRLSSDPKVAAYEQARKRIADAVTQQLSTCTEVTTKTSHALFISIGGRWVTPGLQPIEGESTIIERAFGSATYEFFTPAGVELAAQVRYLGQRLSADATMDRLFDFGVSARYSSGRMSFAAEATSVLGPTSRAAVALAVELPLSEDFSISIGGRGTGPDVVSSLRAVAPSVSVQFQDVAALRKFVPDILVPTQ